MTGSNRICSHTDLKRNNETLGNFTAEGDDLTFNERNFEGQTHIHHRNKAE